MGRRKCQPWVRTEIAGISAVSRGDVGVRLISVGTNDADLIVVPATRQDLSERAFRFAAAVPNRYSRLAAAGPAQSHMTQQLFRSVSAIGANLEEGKVANSRRDMALKHAIALREARETRHWLRLLATQPEWTEELAPLVTESSEFIAMLTVSVRRLRTPSPEPPGGRSER